MYPKPFSWARNERKLFSDGKSRGPLLERVALKSLIFSICRPAMFLVLKFIDRCKKNHIVAGFVVLYNLPNILSKNKFVPLLARRGSKLRCCEKLHVGQHCKLKEWNQRNGIQLLHNMSTKSNIRTASPFFSVISCSVLIYIHLPPPHPSLHISQFQNWLNGIKGIYLLQPYIML